MKGETCDVSDKICILTVQMLIGKLKKHLY